MRRNSRGALRDLNTINRRLIDEAAVRRGRNPDDVVPGLMFGFWMHMTDRGHERDVWIAHLHHAWPSGTNRADLHRRISTVNEERNRVAHHERLYDPSRPELLPSDVARDIVELTFLLDAEVGAETFGPREGGKARAFLAEHPCPASVSY